MRGAAARHYHFGVSAYAMGPRPPAFSAIPCAPPGLLHFAGLYRRDAHMPHGHFLRCHIEISLPTNSGPKYWPDAVERHFDSRLSPRAAAIAERPADKPRRHIFAPARMLHSMSPRFASTYIQSLPAPMRAELPSGRGSRTSRRFAGGYIAHVWHFWPILRRYQPQCFSMLQPLIFDCMLHMTALARPTLTVPRRPSRRAHERLL